MTVSATVEIDVRGRWDALALSRRLAAYHAYLVQVGRERWLVHAEAPGSHGELLDDALRAVDEWRSARGVEEAPVRVREP